MYGNFSPEAIEAFTEIVGEENFSEGLFDFTRCVRANGTAYGTKGKCKSGSEQAKEIQEKSPSAKERQANPGKETFDKGVRDRRENFDTRTRPKDPLSDGPVRTAYLKQTLDNEMKRQNRPEIVAGLKKKLAEAEGKP
jgi:hypothetical protein